MKKSEPHYLGHRARLRDRFLKSGIQGMADYEVVELLLTLAIPRKWDFQNGAFMQGWVAFRTRKERKLPLVSDPHAYDKPGRYRILVKVIDIFGNDTSQAFDVEVPLP